MPTGVFSLVQRFDEDENEHLSLRLSQGGVCQNQRKGYKRCMLTNVEVAELVSAAQ